LNDRDAAHRLIPNQSLTDEKIDMRLEKAACAELKDRECGHSPKSQ
jgi:hypothetical protein